MRIPFRQGIVRCLDPGFLSVGPSFVSLNVTDNPLVVAIAHGSVDYLWVEQRTSVNAWGPITSGVDQWLYWDLNLQTAVRTFGITKVKPIAQGVPPVAPVDDQHWFDTSTGTMKYWKMQVNRWMECIRVFACELNDGSVPVSTSIKSPNSFLGTQVGILQPCHAGTILFDVATGKPLRTADNKFLTGETKLQASTGAVSNLKAETIIVEAEAQENIPAYTIVKFIDFGKIEAANQFTSGTPQQFGIIEESAVIGDIVTVTTTGVVASPTWLWTTMNAYLYADENGQLTTMAIGNVPPVGIVIDVNKILLFAAGTTAGSGGSGGVSSPATTSQLGTTLLSVPAADPQNPIVVGTNDSRVTQALLRTGGTMTGPLTLYANPVNAYDAATKSYVDGQISTNGTTHAKTNNDITPLYIGTPVYSTGPGTVAKAFANTADSAEIMGLTSSTQVDVGSIGQIQTSGLLTATTGQWDAVTGQTGGLTEGAIYYVSAAPAGKLTTIPPSAPGLHVSVVEMAVSSTQMFINTQIPILL